MPVKEESAFDQFYDDEMNFEFRDEIFGGVHGGGDGLGLRDLFGSRLVTHVKVDWPILTEFRGSKFRILKSASLNPGPPEETRPRSPLCLY